MGISVKDFGTGGKRARIFHDIYFSIEDVDGIGIIYTKTGEYSAIIRMENPVLKFSADEDSYYGFVNLILISGLKLVAKALWWSPALQSTMSRYCISLKWCLAA